MVGLGPFRLQVLMCRFLRQRTRFEKERELARLETGV